MINYLKLRTFELKTMKKILIVISCLMLFGQIKAQVDINYGIGLNYGLHFFNHQSNTLIERELYQPDIALVPQLNLFSTFKTKNFFDIRCNINLGVKKVVVANKFPVSQGIMKEAIEHDIFSADLSIVSIYNMDKIALKPIVGFYASFNQYGGVTHSNSIRGRGFTKIDQNNVTNISFQTEEEPFFVNVGINIGTSYKISGEKKDIEFYLLGYFLPMNFFPSELKYQINYIDEYFNGKYHYITIGCNIHLKKYGR
mgnify:CR=1 FL=1